MKATAALSEIAHVTGSQWGMITTSQAGDLGVSRLNLSRLAEAGHLVRLQKGVYRNTGAPADEFAALRAAWLNSNPAVLAEKRLRNATADVVIAGTSAARLHGIGDFWANRQEFLSPRRRQSQRSDIRFRQRALDETDITIVDGLPVITVEYTIADLVDSVGDLSLVGDALADAVKRFPLDASKLREYLDPLAARNGFQPHDGSALLAHLAEIAGMDPKSVSKRLATDSAIGQRVVIDYLTSTSFLGLMENPVFRDSFTSLRNQIAHTSREVLSRRFAEMSRSFEPNYRQILKDMPVEDISEQIATRLWNPDIMQGIANQWAEFIRSEIGTPKVDLVAMREPNPVIHNE